MAYSFPIELYQQIEEKLGKELATATVKSVEAAVVVIEQRSDELAVQKKLELKDELTKELATKADILVLRSEMLAIQGKIEGEIKVVREEIKVVREEIKSSEARVTGELKTLNTKFNFVVILVMIALTIMNPTVAELLKKWLKF